MINYIQGDACIWEQEPMERLAREGELSVYSHTGFWQPMDTLRDKTLLEELWQNGQAPWNVWNGICASDLPLQLQPPGPGMSSAGGDWGKDRLVPDCIRAFLKGEPVHLRNPNAIRPWQHVLEPLSGYMLLAQRLVQEGAKYAN